MVTVKLYVEGGGDFKKLQSQCRQGFRTFLEKAGFKGHMPRIVSCGGRREAYDRFNTACRSKEEISLLLIDSEEFVSSNVSPWNHLSNRSGDGFTKPSNATDDQCHLMVVCMESWFLADRVALHKFFGQGFNANALPQNSNIEFISKKDVYDGLQNATSHCKPKAPYGKGEHSFKILGLINPTKVCAVSPWAKRFLDALKIFINS